MKQFAHIFAHVLVAGLMISAGPAYACSPAELIQKQKAYGDAVKAAFDRDPAGDDARKSQAMVVIGRYSGLKPGPGGYIIDMLCKENDELYAIYK
ncbi:MAG TPA: hypothetical protein VIY51_03005 [Xanthobacteraceae bacterium]